MRFLELPPFFRPSVSLRNKSHLPSRPGVYYALQWWKPFARPLYIGESGDINARWNSRNYGPHHKLSELSKYFGVRLHYRLTVNKSVAVRQEAIDQRRYRPTLNRKLEPLRKDNLRDVLDFCFDSLLIGVILSVVMVAIVGVMR